ncbi:MAG: hypothetical protein MUF06_11290 [Pirellulaceae bacterium]|nr:hypothetical protein [Pirellulaceae bacterium]
MIYSDQELHFKDHGSRAVFSDLEFHECYFEGCTVSMTLEVGRRTTVRNIRLVDCSQRGCLIGCAIIEDCIVDGLNTHGQALRSMAAVFNRVIFRGKVGTIMISDLVSSFADESTQSKFASANKEYYRSVDWAIDISEASCLEADLRGMPGHLVRRDPETQVLVTREKAQSNEWRDLPFKTGWWQTTCSIFLRGDQESTVVVAPKRSREFRELMHDLDLLRKAGISEPD